MIFNITSARIYNITSVYDIISMFDITFVYES